MSELTDTQADIMAMEIIKQLDGLTVAEAQWVLKEATLLLNNTHCVSVTNPLFTAAAEALQRASAPEA